MEKIIYKSMFPKLAEGVIDKITQVAPNRFEVIAHSDYSKNYGENVLEALKNMGFYEDNEELRVVKRVMTTIDTWACMRLTVKFWDFSYKRFN